MSTLAAQAPGAKARRRTKRLRIWARRIDPWTVAIVVAQAAVLAGALAALLHAPG